MCVHVVPLNGFPSPFVFTLRLFLQQLALDPCARNHLFFFLCPICPCWGPTSKTFLSWHAVFRPMGITQLRECHLYLCCMSVSNDIWFEWPLKFQMLFELEGVSPIYTTILIRVRLPCFVVATAALFHYWQKFNFRVNISKKNGY